MSLCGGFIWLIKASSSWAISQRTWIKLPYRYTGATVGSARSASLALDCGGSRKKKKHLHILVWIWNRSIVPSNRRLIYAYWASLAGTNSLIVRKFFVLPCLKRARSAESRSNGSAREPPCLQNIHLRHATLAQQAPFCLHKSSGNLLKWDCGSGGSGCQCKSSTL